MKPKPSFTLPPEVMSPQDLQALILEVRDYAKWYAHASVKKQVTDKDPGEPPAMAHATKAVLQAWNTTKPISKSSLDELITGLQEFANTAPKLHITLAAPPTAGLKKELVAWCRENVAPLVLVNFRFNATILGGMVVRSGSHVYDWSFRRSILENRNKFAEALRHV